MAENQGGKIECVYSKKVIQSARWYVDGCGSSDVTAKILQLCPVGPKFAFMDTCQLKATEANFGNPCTGKKKTLTVNYTCVMDL